MIWAFKSWVDMQEYFRGWLLEEQRLSLVIGKQRGVNWDSLVIRKGYQRRSQNA